MIKVAAVNIHGEIQYLVNFEQPPLDVIGTSPSSGIEFVLCDVDVIADEQIMAVMYYANGKFLPRPLKPGDFYIWRAGAWVFDIDLAREFKSREIEGNCKQEIVSGFYSQALGASHFYESGMEDQANLVASVSRSTLPGVVADEIYPYKCRDLDNVSVFRPHTAAQIQQVGRDGYAAILLARQKNSELQAEIAAASDQASLEAIHW